MLKRNALRTIFVFGAVLSLAGVVRAQNPPEKTDKTLVVNGKTVGAEVIQVNGRTFVDIEHLAEITNGVVTEEPNRIVLTIPVLNRGGSSNGEPDAARTAAAQSPSNLSRNFVKVSVATLAEMREWRGVIGTMITYGLAVSGTWSQSYQTSVQQGLTQAMDTAVTDSDRSAATLLQSEFDKLAAWAGQVEAARQALNAERTIDANASQNDPALTKINACGQFLDAMLVSGTFDDNASCH